MTIIDGKKISENILLKIKNKVNEFNITGIFPQMAAILVGNDPASQLYVSIKEKTCQKVGIKLHKYEFPSSAHEKDIIKLIEKLNSNKQVHGIIVQLPLPKKFNTNKIIQIINPKKDIDGLHPENLGKLIIGEATIIPPTPAGIIEIFKTYKIDLSGKNIVLIGYGKLVGKPLSMLLALSQKDPTITICNSKTKNLSSFTRQADILISAVGQANLITADMIKNNVVIIDAGTTKIGGKIVGDVDFENVKEKTSYITPPKGGVGPLTVAKLLENLIKATK